MINDSIFKKIENKTNIDKNTILSIADKLQKSDMKDDRVLGELIDDLSKLTGKDEKKKKKEKIIKAIKNDKVPSNLDSIS